MISSSFFLKMKSEITTDFMKFASFLLVTIANVLSYARKPIRAYTAFSPLPQSVSLLYDFDEVLYKRQVVSDARPDCPFDRIRYPDLARPVRGLNPVLHPVRTAGNLPDILQDHHDRGWFGRRRPPSRPLLRPHA